MQNEIHKLSYKLYVEKVPFFQPYLMFDDFVLMLKEDSIYYKYYIQAIKILREEKLKKLKKL